MKHVQTKGTRSFFKVVAETARSQAATMVLKPGQSTGGDDNLHEDADQWLYVVSGKGRATVGRTTERLEKGSLLLIEAGETHEIRNAGRTLLVTINVYAPPEY
ncbi:MAG TPA: cupin domain-containing protein [bacterium]|jgi:mannose-6-phosphate isomerase-like protein (cupin superfamily)|nr:cupin domain-containing protein [bacterium]